MNGREAGLSADDLPRPIVGGFLSGRPKTLAALLDERARIHPDRVMLCQDDEELSYSAVAQLSQNAAAVLRAGGLRSGSRFAVLSEHTISLWVVLLGAARIGAVPVLVNTRLAQPEIEVILEDAECSLVLYSQSYSDSAEKLWQGLDARPADIVDLQSMVSEFADIGRPARAAAHQRPAPEDDLVQLYTSGTTGLPKGVRTSNANMIELLTLVHTELPHFGPESVHLVAAPPFHIAGYGYALAGLMGGAQTVLVPEFDPTEVARIIEDRRCTNTLLVPAMLQALLDTPSTDAYDLSSIRSILYGGSPMSEALMRRVVQRFEADLTQAFGLTETTGFATLLRFDDHRRGLAARPGSTDAAILSSAGYPVPGCELAVVDDRGARRDEGQPGEVLVRGPLVMAGYWNRPDANASVLDDAGWFHTGDVGYLEGGRLFLVDRLGDKIVTKGENVFPGEIERILAELPAVSEVAVVGVPSEEYGEMLCAVVVLSAGRSLTLGDVQDACRDRLAGFKLPRRLEISDSPLPRTPSGKVQRRLVREPFWESEARRIN